MIFLTHRCHECQFQRIDGSLFVFIVFAFLRFFASPTLYLTRTNCKLYPLSRLLRLSKSFHESLHHFQRVDCHHSNTVPWLSFDYSKQFPVDRRVRHLLPRDRVRVRSQTL